MLITTVSPQSATTAPWVKSRNEKETQPIEASKTVEWYQPTLKALPAVTVEVFLKYVGLSSEEEVKQHIYSVRGKAWDVYVIIVI